MKHRKQRKKKVLFVGQLIVPLHAVEKMVMLTEQNPVFDPEIDRDMIEQFGNPHRLGSQKLYVAIDLRKLNEDQKVMIDAYSAKRRPKRKK